MTKATASTTTALDLMLQNGLEITSEGTCTRHPGVVVCSKEKGGVSSCEVCDQEQKQGDSEMAKGNQALRGQGSADAELGVSLSKIVSGLPDSPAAATSGETGTNNKNRSFNDNSNFNNTGMNMDADADADEEEDGNLETLIARWCQLQGATATGKPSNDMLSTTLVLLQLQKLERRVLHQERSLQNIQHNMREQQSAIQVDLTRILSYVAGVSNASAASASNTETGRTSKPGSRLRQPQHGAQEVVDAPQKRLDKSVGSHRRKHGSGDGSLQFSGVFNSVRTLERQPPKPPKRHDSLQSLGRVISVEDLSINSSARDNAHNKQLNPPPPPPPPRTHTTAACAASTISTKHASPSMGVHKTASTVTTNKIRNPLGAAGHPLKPKSSFRNLPGPQLEIIWDASEHTQGAAGTTSGNTTPGSRNGIPSDPKDLFKGKGALPKLASSLDDGNDNDNDEGEELDELSETLNVFSGTQNYTHKNAGINLHDSIVTSAFASFGGDTSFSDTGTEDDTDYADSDFGDNDGIPLIHGDKKARKREKKEMKKEKKMLKKEKKKEKKEIKRELKDKKKKDEKKKDDASNEFSSGSNDHSSIHRSTTKFDNKVSPSQPVDEKPRNKGRFSAAKNIIWKRSSSSKSTDFSFGDEEHTPAHENSPGMPELHAPVRETSPIMPQRQISVQRAAFEDIRVINDNPRTHRSPISGRKDIQVQSINVEMKLDANGNIATAPGEEKVDNGDCADDITTKTPFSARTPYSAIVNSATPLEPPPPPQPQQHRQEQMRKLQQRRAAEGGQENGRHPPSPPPRRRQQFPRTLGMMPKLVNSKRDIVIGGTGESARMQISTLTLDTALPSADAGSVLQEVNNQSLTDKCKERGSYTGTISEADEPDGYGTMLYNSGAFYKGQWKEGHWHGEGILRTPNGDSYEGDFVYDCRHGRGIYKYENGDVYEGDFSTDKRHGKGTFLFQNGSMYRGDFAYGNFHGYGWYEFEEGYYEGSWLDGSYEGIGTLTYKDASHYTGRFKAGVADGLGEERKADGTGRRGMWKKGEFEGQERDPSSSVLSI